MRAQARRSHRSRTCGGDGSHPIRPNLQPKQPAACHQRTRRPTSNNKLPDPRRHSSDVRRRGSRRRRQRLWNRRGGSDRHSLRPYLHRCLLRLCTWLCVPERTGSTAHSVTHEHPTSSRSGRSCGHCRPMVRRLSARISRRMATTRHNNHVALRSEPDPACRVETR